ncbi:MAG: S9 family peptidase, partial [Bacteroidetes bacterium]
SESSDTYIEEPDDNTWHFLADGDLIWLSEQSGFRHIYRYGPDGKVKKALTEGDFEVTDIAGIDEAGDRVFFTSTEDSPLERHLYSVSLSGKKKKRLSEGAGTHEVALSAGYRYFTDTWSNISQVPVTRLCKSDGETMRVLADNKGLDKKLSALKLGKAEFFSFQTASKTTLNAWRILPPDFDEKKKYPVLMFVYGGPGSQTVTNEWGFGSGFNYMWYQMLAQKGYVVVSVDNRGTGARGRDFRDCTYADLGHLEAEDQIESAKYLQTLPWVDGKRIGIWGWSYGGYMTSLCLTKGKGVFKMGIAVAPVTNWRFYDTIYTERFLKTPQLNPKGYDDNSPINFAKDLQGSFLLVHGTGDDNVHFQNSMEMVTALVGANKEFDSFFYPNKNHGIYGGYTRFHLYRKMTNFVLENL